MTALDTPPGLDDAQVADRLARAGRAAAGRAVDFGIYFFAGDTEDEPDKYRFLLDAARAADRAGYASVWLPERHFHGFGGLYPNPATVAAALAATTSRIELRAGSVVLPLHHPARVVEEWSVVDNLSGGRVGLSFAPGWHPGDFVLRPQAFADRSDRLPADIDRVRRLWAGERISFPGPDGEPHPVRTYPRPIQPELPWWITSSGNPRTFERAGRLGANVLSALIGLSMDDLAERVSVYRAARAEAGLDPATGTVTVMVHAFVGTDGDQVRAEVLEPMRAYLRSYLAQQRDASVALPSDDDLELQVEFATERYLNGLAMIGTPERCAEVTRRLAGCDVDEIACLIDFGVPPAKVLRSIRRLGAFAAARSAAGAPGRSRPQDAAESSGPARRRALAARLASASPEQRERVIRAWASRRPATVAGAAPCTTDQRRLVQVELREPSRAGNNVAGGLLFSPGADAAGLRAALTDVVLAHECLHSRFERNPDGGLARVVDPALLPEWEERDVRDAVSSAPDALAEILTEFAGRPFDLTTGPLVRAAFLTVADEEHGLALVIHHSVTDWVTMNVVVEQLLDRYGTGQAPRAEGMTFTEAAVREADVSGSGAVGGHTAFWRTELAGAPEAVVARRDGPARPARTFRSGRQWFVLGAETSDAMSALARTARCTPFAVGLAAYAGLLSRLADTSDVLVGTPGANREVPGIERTAGLLMTMLPLRLRLRPDAPFTDAVEVARHSFTRALGHQLPLDDIARAVRPEARLEHLPLFRSRYLYLTWHAPQQFGATTVSSIDVDPGATFYDGTMALWESPHGFFGRWEYDRDRYDEAAARRIAASFCSLLAAAVAAPERRLRDLAMDDDPAPLVTHAGLTAHLRSLVRKPAVR